MPRILNPNARCRFLMQNMQGEEWGSGQIGSGNGGGHGLEAEVGMGSTPVKPGAWAGQVMGAGQGAAERMGLRGGGEGDGRMLERVGGLTLRGGGNSHSAPKEDLGKRKYTRDEHKINKQMCKAVRAGNEEEVKRLLKAGADPCYRWCGPLEYSVMHHGVNHKQFKVVEYLASHGGNIRNVSHPHPHSQPRTARPSVGRCCGGSAAPRRCAISRKNTSDGSHHVTSFAPQSLASTDQRCALGWTLLHQAAHLGEVGP